MKKSLIRWGLAASIVGASFPLFSDMQAHEASDVCVNVKGNGKSLVEVRVGPNDHSGACCTGISNNSTVKICGKSGYNVYDSDTKRLLFSLSPSLNGQTVDLRAYY